MDKKDVFLEYLNLNSKICFFFLINQVAVDIKFTKLHNYQDQLFA